MAFSARCNQGSLDGAKDAIPITASSTLNVLGGTFNVTNGPASEARCCKAILASGTTTFTGVMATGQTRTGLIVPAGVTPLQLIQVTAITGGGGTLWALI
jgi:hypothetical protein